MRQSSRAKRMNRHHMRGKRTPAFNLVALMDIFTILVFFLLVNSGEVSKLPDTKNITLPQSIVNIKPEDSVVITVSRDAVIVEGREIITLDAIRNSKSEDIPELAAALREELSKKRVIVDGKEIKTEVAVMSDEDLPYNILHRIMQSFSSVNVDKISLAVIQKAPEIDQ